MMALCAGGALHAPDLSLYACSCMARSVMPRTTGTVHSRSAAGQACRAADDRCGCMTLHLPCARVADRGHHQRGDSQQHRAAGAVRGRLPCGRRPAVAAAGRVAAAWHAGAATLPAAPARGPQLRRPAHHIRPRPGKRHYHGASRIGRRTYQSRIASAETHCCQPHLLRIEILAACRQQCPSVDSEGAASAARTPAHGFISTW